MNYSQALESLIQEIVYYGDSAERRDKVHRQALLDGVEPDEVDIIIKGRISKAQKQTSQTPPQAPPPPPSQQMAPPPSQQQMAPPPPPQQQMAPPPPPPSQPVQPQYASTPTANTGKKDILKNPLLWVIVAFGLCASVYFVFFNHKDSTSASSDNNSVVEKKEVTDTVVVVKEEKVYDNNQSLKDELKSKVMSIWAEGIKSGNSLFMFKKYCSKDFCDTFDKYEKFLNGDFGSLDYDVWTQAQDTEGFKYKVSDVLATDNKHVTILMDLTNFGNTQQIKVEMIKEKDKWVIDDFINAQHSVKQLMRDDMSQ